MRYLWLWVLFSLPVSAGELQVDISGRAFDSQTQSFGTLQSADVDTLSGIQIYTSTSAGLVRRHIARDHELTADVNGGTSSASRNSGHADQGVHHPLRNCCPGPDSLRWD
jgi:hypothetical protein